jgi:hypothetical protein
MEVEVVVATVGNEPQNVVVVVVVEQNWKRCWQKVVAVVVVEG